MLQICLHLFSSWIALFGTWLNILIQVISLNKEQINHIDLKLALSQSVLLETKRIRPMKMYASINLHVCSFHMILINN